MRLRQQLARFLSRPRPAGDGAPPPRSAAQLLWQRRDDAALARLLDGYVWSLPLALFATPWSAAPRLAASRRRYRHADQRPLFYLPFLEAAPRWERAPGAEILEEHYPVILEEFRQVDEELRRHPERAELQRGFGRADALLGAGDWSIFNLYRQGVRVERNCALCPRTVEIAESLPLCTDGQAMLYFSVMTPGTHVKPHCGFTNTRLRYHLGIEVGDGVRIRAGQQWHRWQPGRVLAFDDSFEHEVVHEGDRRRVVLLLDVWHPGLRPDERAAVLELMQALELPTR